MINKPNHIYCSKFQKGEIVRSNVLEQNNTYNQSKNSSNITDFVIQLDIVSNFMLFQKKKTYNMK